MVSISPHFQITVCLISFLCMEVSISPFGSCIRQFTRRRSTSAWFLESARTEIHLKQPSFLLKPPSFLLQILFIFPKTYTFNNTTPSSPCLVADRSSSLALSFRKHSFNPSPHNPFDLLNRHGRQIEPPTAQRHDRRALHHRQHQLVQGRRQARRQPYLQRRQKALEASGCQGGEGQPDVC